MTISLCTHNPVGDNKIKPKNLEVSGSAQLSDATLPVGVFVWLEGLELSTLTDSAGEYRLQLPAPELQTGGGLTGMYKIYYYVANYKFAVASVAIVEGSFVYGEGDISSSGRIARKRLKKLLDIRTAVTPAVFPHDSLGYFRISVAFRNVAEPVDITAFRERGSGNFAGVILNRVGAPINEAQLNLTSIWPSTETVSTDSDWHMNLFSGETTLTVGTFNVFPYIFIEQKDLPEELRTSIGQGYDEKHWHTDYLKIPIKQETATVRITE